MLRMGWQCANAPRSVLDRQTFEVIPNVEGLRRWTLAGQRRGRLIRGLARCDSDIPVIGVHFPVEFDQRQLLLLL